MWHQRFQSPIQLHFGMQAGVQVLDGGHDQPVLVPCIHAGQYRRHELGVVAMLAPDPFLI